MLTAPAATTLLPLAAIVLPAAGVLAAAPLARSHPAIRLAVLSGLAAATLVTTILVSRIVLSGTAPVLDLLHLMPGVRLRLRVDAAGALVAIVAALLWLLAVIHSHGYLRGDANLVRYHGFLMLGLGLTLGVAYSGTLVTFLAFYELMSLLAYPLIVHDGSERARAAGLKYVVYALFGGSLLVFGVIGAAFAAPTLDFGTGGMLAGPAGPLPTALLFWCLATGFGVKAALLPLQGWVLDAHPAAPAPFSAVLSGILVGAGTLGLLRVVTDVFGVSLVRELGVAPWLAGVAATGAILAAILAINEDDLKRRLAWSTVSQMAFVSLAIALLHPVAVTGALVHLAHHGVMKATLFLGAGILAHHGGIERVSQAAGAGKRFPLTMLAITLAALGMIGVPPLAGFPAKWWLGLGMLEAGQPAFLAVLLGGSLLSAAYLLPIVHTAWFQPPAGDAPARDRPEADRSMLMPVVAGGLLTILLGAGVLLPGMPLELARAAAAALFR